MFRHLNARSQSNQNHPLLRHKLSNLCTIFTYSAFTAVCLHIPFALSFAPTLHHCASSNFYKPSSTIFSTSRYHSTSNTFVSQNYNSVLFLRGGASELNSNKQRQLLNMVSTSSETDTALTATNADVAEDPKLLALRSKMKELGVDAFIVPSDDPHLSEYVPTAYMRRKFLSGFGGSAGTAVVTEDKALLWTDSRYGND